MLGMMVSHLLLSESEPLSLYSCLMLFPIDDLSSFLMSPSEGGFNLLVDGDRAEDLNP
jgi:hypothetical protein